MTHVFPKRSLGLLLIALWVFPVGTPLVEAGCLDFVAWVQKVTTQPQVQKQYIQKWGQQPSLTIRPRDLIRVGATDPRTGQFVSGVTLKLYEPGGLVTNPSNGDYLTPPFPGTYTLRATCGNQVKEAYFNVTGPEIDPYGRPGLLGINFLDALQKNTYRCPYENGLFALMDLGAKANRFSFHWDLLEPQAGQYDLYRWELCDQAILDLKNRGIEIIALINGTPRWARNWNDNCPGAGVCLPTPDLVVDLLNNRKVEDYYRDFIQKIATRYNGQTMVNGRTLPQVQFFEFWNEPNGCGLHPECHCPDETTKPCITDETTIRGYYIYWLKQTKNALAGVRPDAKLSIGGLDETATIDWLDFLYKNPVTSGENPRGYFDVLALHPYAWDDVIKLGMITDFRQFMMQNNDDKPIWITEYGWNLNPYAPKSWVNEDDQAKNLIVALNQLSSESFSYVQFASYHGLFDAPFCHPDLPTPEYNELIMGLMETCPPEVPPMDPCPSVFARKAFYALREFTRGKGEDPWDYMFGQQIVLSPMEPHSGSTLTATVRHILQLGSPYLYLHGNGVEGRYNLQNWRTIVDPLGIVWNVWDTSFTAPASGQYKVDLIADPNFTLYTRKPIQVSP